MAYRTSADHCGKFGLARRAYCSNMWIDMHSVEAARLDQHRSRISFRESLFVAKRIAWNNLRSLLQIKNRPLEVNGISIAFSAFQHATQVAQRSNRMPIPAWAGFPPGPPKPGHRRIAIVVSISGEKQTQTQNIVDPTECPLRLGDLFRLGSPSQGIVGWSKKIRVCSRRLGKQNTFRPTECPLRLERPFPPGVAEPGHSFLLYAFRAAERGSVAVGARRMPQWLGWILRL